MIYMHSLFADTSNNEKEVKISTRNAHTQFLKNTIRCLDELSIALYIW